MTTVITNYFLPFKDGIHPDFSDNIWQKGEINAIGISLIWNFEFNSETFKLHRRDILKYLKEVGCLKALLLKLMELISIPFILY